MSAVAERVARVARARRPGAEALDPHPGRARILSSFAAGQAVNVRRHLEALRDFPRAEFGTSIARPSEGHVQAVNELLATLRRPLERAVRRASSGGRPGGDTQRRRATWRELLQLKSRAHDWVRATERVWDFYFELFGQRQSAFGEWLFACDRIALDCYQHVFMHLGTARSIPAPPPFCLHADRLLAGDVPPRHPAAPARPAAQPVPAGPAALPPAGQPLDDGRDPARGQPQPAERARSSSTRCRPSIVRRLRAAGAPEPVARTWVRWNREIFGDMVGCMLGGEAFVASLMDVIGRSPEQALAYSPHGVHPTPYLRTFLSTRAAAPDGLPRAARAVRRAWRRLYPSTVGRTTPAGAARELAPSASAPSSTRSATPVSLAGQQVAARGHHFEPRHQAMIEEAAGRLAKGIDPGVVPERFLIGAVRIAVDRRLAPPGAARCATSTSSWRGGEPCR